ncbi:MAG: GvpL/GvpF family gas vesicle protein [Parvularculaceae bacterium]
MAKYELLGVGFADAFSDEDTASLKGRGVETVRVADLVGFVSTRPFRLLPRPANAAGRNILRIQQKLEAILAVEGFLPAAFGTAFDEREDVQAFLMLNKATLRSSISTHGAFHQYQIAVTWRPERMLAALGQSAEVEALKADGAARGKKEVASALQSAAAAMCAAMSGDVVERVTEASDQCRRIPVGDPPMIANLVCLVRPSGVGELETALEEIDADYDDQLLIKLSGPLPPCSFASIVKRDVSPEAVRNAKERIGVEDISSMAAIKRAYKEFMKSAHPDVGGAAELADEGAKAYRLLKQLAAIETDLRARLDHNKAISLCHVGASEAA